jgi:putative transposase
MVRQVKSQFSVDVTHACEVLSVSRSGYYDWLERPASERAMENEILVQKIKEIYHNNREVYGSPRIAQVLKSEGIICSENRVAKLMKESAISADIKKKFKVVTTDSNHQLPIAERVLETENVEEVVQAPNMAWVSDITYIRTQDGFVYLAVFLDLFTRKIVGWSIADHMRTDLVLNALNQAIGRQNFEQGHNLIIHTDRGSQYASDEFRTKLKNQEFIASMSRKGNCYDNAFAESFFHSLKIELVYRTEFENLEDAKKRIFEYIEVFYNNQRLHSSLGYITPNECEKLSKCA